MDRDAWGRCREFRFDWTSLRLRCGIMFLIIGILWLAEKAGWMPTGYLGPVVLTAIGVWLVITSRLLRNKKGSAKST